jgi:hypothetical protein
MTASQFLWYFVVATVVDPSGVREAPVLKRLEERPTGYPKTVSTVYTIVDTSPAGTVIVPIMSVSMMHADSLTPVLDLVGNNGN